MPQVASLKNSLGTLGHFNQHNTVQDVVQGITDTLAGTPNYFSASNTVQQVIQRILYALEGTPNYFSASNTVESIVTTLTQRVDQLRRGESSVRCGPGRVFVARCPAKLATSRTWPDDTSRTAHVPR